MKQLSAYHRYLASWLLLVLLIVPPRFNPWYVWALAITYVAWCMMPLLHFFYGAGVLLVAVGFIYALTFTALPPLVLLGSALSVVGICFIVGLGAAIRMSQYYSSNHKRAGYK